MSRNPYGLTAVYLLKNRWSESNYKIGISNSPSRRIIEVNELYEVDAVVVTCLWFPRVIDAQISETTWHRRLAQYRTDDHGGKEWFCLTPSQVDSFKEWASKGLSRPALKDLIYVKGASDKWLRAYSVDKRNAIPKVTQHFNRISIWKSKTHPCMSSSRSESNRCTRSESETSQRRLRKRSQRCTPPTPSTDSKQLNTYSHS